MVSKLGAKKSPNKRQLPAHDNAKKAPAFQSQFGCNASSNSIGLIDSTSSWRQFSAVLSSWPLVLSSSSPGSACTWPGMASAAGVLATSEPTVRLS
jgi:hypothetical protein